MAKRVSYKKRSTSEPTYKRRSSLFSAGLVMLSRLSRGAHFSYVNGKNHYVVKSVNSVGLSYYAVRPLSNGNYEWIKGAKEYMVPIEKARVVSVRLFS